MALFPASERPQAIQPHGVAKWSLAVRIFHWISVLLLILTWAMIELDEDAVTDQYFDLHQAFGLSVLAWTIGRIVSRLVTKSPYAIPMSKWQTGLSHLTHAALYFLLLAMPIAGWLTVMYAGNSVEWFGVFTLPSFVDESRELSRWFEKAHKDWLWPLLLGFTGLHILGALYHRFIQKDHLINRMR